MNKDKLRLSANRELVKKQLKTFALELLDTFDLSPSKASELSRKVSKRYRFQPHQLLSKSGEPKTGGSQRNGSLKIDQYISYRLGDDIFALVGVQRKDSDSIYYEVLGPKDFMIGYRTFLELRPYLDKYDGVIAGGVVFDCFNDAKRAYVDLLSKYAPTR